MISELNSNIFIHVQKENPRGRILRYALDPSVISEQIESDCIDEIKQSTNPFKLLVNYPWAVGVLMVRRFYNSGDGKDFIEQFFSLFDGIAEARIDQYQRRLILNKVFGAWRSPNISPARQRFLTECWIVRHGPNSEIWKENLLPFVRQLGNNREEWQESADRFRENSESPYFRWLLDNGGPSFWDSIEGFRQNADEEWCSTFFDDWNQHEQDMSSAQSDWILKINGNLCELILAIYNIHIRGNQYSVRLNRYNRELMHGSDWCQFSHTEVQNVLATNPRARLEVGNSSISVAASSHLVENTSPLVFRWYGERHNHWYVPVHDRRRPVSARRLAIVCSAGGQYPQVCLGGQPIQINNIGNVSWFGGEQRRVFTMDLPGCARAQPLALTVDGTALLHVGGQPYAEIQTQETDIQILNEEAVHIVFGDEARICLQNMPENANPTGVWTTPNGGAIDPVDGNIRTIRLRRDAQAYGVKHEIKIQWGGVHEVAKAHVVFLPPEVKALMMGQQASVEWNGWTWTAGTNVEFAKDRKQTGTLRCGDWEKEISIPLQRPIWWWKQNAFAEEQDVYQSKTVFARHEVLGWYFYFAWPLGVDAPEFEFRGERLDIAPGDCSHGKLATELFDAANQVDGDDGGIIDLGKQNLSKYL
jgi:hypothetical protein